MKFLVEKGDIYNLETVAMMKGSSELSALYKSVMFAVYSS